MATPAQAAAEILSFSQLWWPPASLGLWPPPSPLCIFGLLPLLFRPCQIFPRLPVVKVRLIQGPPG